MGFIDLPDPDPGEKGAGYLREQEKAKFEGVIEEADKGGGFFHNNLLFTDFDDGRHDIVPVSFHGELHIALGRTFEFYIGYELCAQGGI